MRREWEEEGRNDLADESDSGSHLRVTDTDIKAWAIFGQMLERTEEWSKRVSAALHADM